MSGASKRLHEEGSHSSATKYPHEDSGLFSNHGDKMTAPNEYRVPFDLGQEARMAKIPRAESRDADKRSHMLPLNRIASSSNDSHVDHPALFNNRDLKIDNRDMRPEMGKLEVEAKRDIQSAKGEKDIKFEGRGDDYKEVKYNKDGFNDLKGDVKMEKYKYSLDTPAFKELAELCRGSPEHADKNMEWITSRSHIHGQVEAGKEVVNPEERDSVGPHEAVGENRVDFKAEDRLKEKDRKKKDAKHRDWGEREKERSDRRNILQTVNSSNECKEYPRQEREAERWEREKKDVLKDKERSKEREKEKDHNIRRELSPGVEKEGPSNEKEKKQENQEQEKDYIIVEQENLGLELKKQKDPDGWKAIDRETREKRKERDADVDGDTPENGSRAYEKASDEGCVEVNGGSERERDVFNYGVQQRKRMLRPRGSPQLANREPRFRSRQDTDGSQGRPEVSTVVYKVGECMQELIRLWKEYESSQAVKNPECFNNGPTLEIRIPAEHVTATNRQVRGGQLWGTDIYTDDSDLVAVLMHTGYCRPTASPPPPAILELRATVRVLPPQDCYVSTLRNNVRSRAWGAAIGCSYRVERCCIVKKGGGTIDLEPCLTHTSTVEPTLAPVAVERTMTTRAAASNALRQQRFVREVTIQYNLCNEPWIKYSISIVADKGLKKPLYTSARLKKGEVLYLETHSRRYELCFTGMKVVKAQSSSQVHEAETDKCQNHEAHASNGEKNSVDGDNFGSDVFRWSRCKTPLPQKFMRSVGVPLPFEYLEVLEENLDWEDIQWSQTGVWIAGKEYVLARVHFLSPN